MPEWTWWLSEYDDYCTGSQDYSKDRVNNLPLTSMSFYDPQKQGKVARWILATGSMIRFSRPTRFFGVCVYVHVQSVCVCVCGVCLVFWWSLCISFMSCISCSLGLGFSTIAWCVKWTGLYFMRTPGQWHLRTDHWWCSILKFFFKYVLEFHFSCECFFERSLLRCTFPMISQLLYQQYGGFRKWGYP